MIDMNEKLLYKKLEDYNSKLEDFSCENELTVEITLNEYRRLIKEVAVKNYELEKINYR